MLKRTKPGLLVRLSNLIIVQVVFIFAALIMFLFFGPDENAISKQESVLGDLVSKLRATEAGSGPECGSAGWAERALENFSPEAFMGSPIRAAALFVVGESDSPLMITRWSLLESEDDGGSQMTGFPSAANMSMVAFVAEQEDSFSVSALLDAEHSIQYYHWSNGSFCPVVVAAILDNDLFLADRSDLLQGLFLLFLCSTLISLLTVHLISRRLREPMFRLIEGLERTTRGELGTISEGHSDEEISRLTSSFNTMITTLWENRLEMRQQTECLRNTNASLERSQAFLSTLIDCSPMSILVTDGTGNVCICNEAVARDFKCDPQDLIGCKIDDLVRAAPESETGERDTRPNQGFEALCQFGNGEHFPAYVVRNDVRANDNTDEAHIYILKNIAESESFQEMMIRIDRHCTRGEMAGDIAHDINNYLAILSGNVELLPIILRKQDPEKTEQKLEVLRQTVDKITHFANSLMETSQDEAFPEYGSLNQVVENVVALLKPQKRFHAVNLRAELVSDVPFTTFDFGQIQQLLVNLIFNAADAVADQEQAGEIIVSTCMRERDGKSYSCIQVSDNGPGVREDKVSSLFGERFTTKRKGHGIGLVSCQRIVESHDGHIGYELDGGAVFSVCLPVTQQTVRQNSSEMVPHAEM